MTQTSHTDAAPDSEVPQAAGPAARMGVAILLVEVAVVLALGVTSTFDGAAHWRDLLPF